MEYFVRYFDKHSDRAISVDTFKTMKSAERCLADYNIWRDAPRGPLVSHIEDYELETWEIRNSPYPAKFFDVHYK